MFGFLRRNEKPIEVKYLIAGLGNVGAEYAGTRHNIGFSVLDALAGASDAFFASARYGDIVRVSYRGRTMLLLKPSTYMNLSGKAVRYWMAQEKIPLENLLVVLDDLALPPGSLRLRARGSDGGHNGLKSIDECLGSSDYARLRLGIGHDFHPGGQVDYVLGRWPETERPLVKAAVDESVGAIRSFVTQGVERTMNLYNKKGIAGRKPE